MGGGGIKGIESFYMGEFPMGCMYILNRFDLPHAGTNIYEKDEDGKSCFKLSQIYRIGWSEKARGTRIRGRKAPIPTKKGPSEAP